MGIFPWRRGKSGVQNDRTVLNQEASRDSQNHMKGQETVLNPTNQEMAMLPRIPSSDSNTVLNQAVSENPFINPGTIVCDKYTIVRQLDVDTGEADLFICSYQDREYIAKIYRRPVAIKPEVAKSLSEIHSPYVAEIYAMGSYEGYPVEIIPYYKKGSLQGRTFSARQLRENIIPSLNEGLNVLHSHGIIHKDLKPANIMLNEDEKTVSIIDFGISTMAERGNTVVVTHTGLTPEYSAPETFRSLFLVESDYYSLGITVFELSEGHSPYAGLTQEEIAQFALIQKVPLPDHMDGSIKDLITGLTYNDITNRKDKSNPNRRWVYEEVKKWCEGQDQFVPGTTSEMVETIGRFRPYRFQGSMYDNMDDLIVALAKDWENGKKQLFRGTLGGHFNAVDAEIADICERAQDELEDEKNNPDLIFFNTLYRMDPHNRKIMWKGSIYESLDDFANKWLDCKRKGSQEMDDEMDDMLNNCVLSTYIACIQPDAIDQIEAMKAFESAHHTGLDRNNRNLSEYKLGFMLSTEKKLVIDKMVFHNVDELSDYLNDLLDQSEESYEAFSSFLIDDRNILDVQFEAWLFALGKLQTLENWRQDDSNVVKNEKQSHQKNYISPVSTSKKWNDLRVGMLIQFGSYPQTEDGKVLPIDWLVLAIEGQKALLLSKYGLDVKPYNTEFTAITWEACTLRTWLNGDFMSKAFSTSEQAAILTTPVDNGSSHGYSDWNTNGGNNTQDKLFLLSYVEANKYMNVTYYNINNLKSRVSPTAYAKAQGAHTSDSIKTEDGNATGWWWLRSPGSRRDGAARVRDVGSLDYEFVFDSFGCVRPAFWLNLESEIF